MELQKETEYSFKGKPFQYASTGGWVFVALPAKVSAQIRQKHKWDEEGWGRLKARARINSTEWKSAIWFDTKQSTYLLPLKAEIRKRENINLDSRIQVTLFI